MKKRPTKKIVAGGGAALLLVLASAGAFGGYSAYAKDRCREDLQYVEDNSYDAYYYLTGDRQAAEEYEFEQQLRVLRSHWCEA